jgi:opacity protein-like surface antigen
MKTSALLVVIAALAATGASAAGPPSAAAVAAGRWVSTVDDGHYGQSWSDAGALFKNRITQDEWAHQVAKARGPLGQVVSRAFKGENTAKTLPGEPDGDYDIVTFDTELTHKKAAVETVILAREDDGWKVDGYFIR